MKKLLLTTALAGATLVSSNAIAQTTISGNLDISFKALSREGTASSTQSAQRGFGKEAQINIQNKGKLNNGMDYAAGFSIEDDGNQIATLFNENTYIDFISGNTTITIGQDHIQHSERTLGSLLGSLVAEDFTNSENTTQFATDGFLSAVGADPAQAFGIGIMQKTPIGTFSALYVPKNGDAVGGDDIAGDSADESATEFGFVGNLDVKGLSVHAFVNEEAKAGTDVRKNKGENYGVSYNMGQITAGVNYKETTFGALATSTVSATRGKTEQWEYGVAYAVTPNLSVGANYTKAENNSSASNKADAKSKSIAIGYNLGPIAVSAQAAKLENFTFAKDVDADVLYLRASTKF